MLPGIGASTTSCPADTATSFATGAGAGAAFGAAGTTGLGAGTDGLWVCAPPFTSSTSTS